MCNNKDMKKEVNNGIEIIKFEDGDDMEFLSKIIGLTLFKNNNILYCANYQDNYALVFDDSKKMWKPFDIEKISGSEIELSDDESMKIFKAYPPFDAFEEMKKDRANKKLEYWNKKRKTTKEKVIGWAYPSENTKYGEATDDKIAAIINDIVAHNYYFGGDELDVVPIFEDNTCLDFSSRGWGNIEALANNMAGDYDYSYFYSASLLKPPFRTPDIGIYKK